MYLFGKKADWLLSINLGRTDPNLVVRILERSLNMQLTKLIGQNLLIVDALGSLGIRQMMDLLRLSKKSELS